MVFAAVFSVGLGGVALWLGRGRLEPDRRVVSIAVSTSGRWIAAGTRIGSITILDQEHPGHLQQFQAGAGKLNDLQFSPDERMLAVANRSLNVYSVGSADSPRSLRSDDRNYGTVRFSADGKRLLTTTGAATIEVLDANSGELQLSICCSTIAGEAAFSSDGSMIVSAGHWPAFWDARSGTLVLRLTGDREFETLRPIAINPQRDWVLMGSQNGRLYAWNLRTGRRVTTSPAHAGYVDSIAIPKGSPWIAYSSVGGPIRLWNPETEAEQQPAHMIATSNLVAGAQPHMLIFGTETGFVEVWDIADGRLSRRYDMR